MSEDMRPLASLSLTHVYYDPDDPLSFLCAWLALLPQALCVVYATLIWSTREAEVALMFAGQLACEAANFALKRLIKEERPARIHGKGYGMPSSHAQFVAFWSVALTLFLLVRHRPNIPPVSTSAYKINAVRPGGGGNGVINEVLHRPFSLAERRAVSVAALGLAAAVAWSRVYLNYHTPKQVLVGCGAGVACAIAWFVVTAVARQYGLLGWVLDLPIARWFRFRDLVVEEDPCQAGWEKWEIKRIMERPTAGPGTEAGRRKQKKVA